MFSTTPSVCSNWRIVRLELAVEHAPVGDDHDRVEDAPVVGVVQRRELVGEPGDGEALAAAGRVLDQVALPRARRARVGDEPAHAVELLVAREDQEALAGLLALVVLLFDLVDELPDEVEHAVARPDLVPQIGRRVAASGVGGTGGLPAPPNLPWLKGRKRVFGPASCVVT